MSIPKEQLEQIFKDADSNQDGFVVLSEVMLAAGSQHSGLFESFMSGDTDQNQRLSLEEFLKYMEQKQA